MITCLSYKHVFKNIKIFCFAKGFTGFNNQKTPQNQKQALLVTWEHFYDQVFILYNYMEVICNTQTVLTGNIYITQRFLISSQ